MFHVEFVVLVDAFHQSFIVADEGSGNLLLLYIESKEE